MKKIAIVLVFLSFFKFISAQNTYPIGGKLKHEVTGEPIVGAAIFAINSDSAVAAGVISDEKGSFRLSLSRGEYTLKINYLGLEPYIELLRVWRDDYLGTIIMKVNTENLTEVNVSQKSLSATINGDTVSYNANAYKTNQNASAKDLVEKMPGVRDNNGEIEAQGEKVQQVLVDGKQFFGQNPKTALATLPAEVVDKIQIFDDKSEQSKASGVDDGSRIKTLNIVTKINMRNGEFGKAYAGYGNDQQYSAGTNLNLFRGDRRLSILGQVNNINQQNFSTEDLLGVVADNSSGRGSGGRGPGGKRPSFLSGFSANGSVNDFMVNPTGGITETKAWGANYQDKWGEKIDINGSYFFNEGDNTSQTNTYQNYYLLNNTGQQYTEESSSYSNNVNHKFNAKMVYKLNPKASFFYLPSVSVQDNRGNMLDTSNTVQELMITNTLNQGFNSDLLGMKFSNNLMFRLNGEKRGRSLFLQFKNSIDRTQGTNTLTGRYTDVNSNLDNVNQMGDLDENIDGIDASIMVSEPLNEKGLGMFVTYDFSNSVNVTNQKMMSGVTSISPGNYDSLLSNEYNNDWLTHSAGMGTRQFGRKGGFVVRLKFEIASLNNNQSVPTLETRLQDFKNILPFALYRAKLKNNASWFSMYRTYTSNPSAQQLSEVLDNSNPLQLSKGNTGLRQQYGHWLMSKYNFASTEKDVVFYAMISGGWTNNFIGQSTFTAIRDTIFSGVELKQGGQLSQPVNLNGQYTYNTFITYGKPISVLKSNLNVDLSSRTTNIPSLINTIKSNTINQSYELGLVLSSNISEKVDFTLSTRASYNSSENTQNSSLNNTYWVHTNKIKYDWIMPFGFTFRTQLNYQKYYGLGAGLNNQVLLWTAGLGKQVFENKRGEIQLSVFDILNQNNNISQNFYDSYYEATNQNVLTRYIMLNFSYTFRKFREDKAE